MSRRRGRRRHVAGQPVAVAVATQKKGETGKCEMPVGRRLLAERDLTNALVSSDALHCQQGTAREILCSGGDHIMQLKANQKTLVQNAQTVVGVSFFADAVRGQWAIESKYHARRDGTYCEDVRTRRYDENITGAMLLARTPTFVFFAEDGTDNCQEFKECLQADTNRIFRLVTSRRKFCG